MFKPLLRAAAPVLLLLSAPLAAQQAPIAPADLLRHIQILASDDFQGRAPATEGEIRTVDYIVAQFRARGLEPAGENGSWFQNVGLVERATQSARAAWTANGRPLDFDIANIALQGDDPVESIADAPVIFAGHGARIPDHGVDQLAGARIEGAVVIILYDAPEIPGFPSFNDRVQTVTDAGAAAVIALAGPDIPWAMVPNVYRRPGIKPADQRVAPVIGAMPIAAAQALLAASGDNLARLLNDQPGSTFRAVALPLRATIQVETSVVRYQTRNVIGRLRGSGTTGENVLFLGHWDHLGLCRPEGEADRICNGAVDNASGIAAMIEIAGRLAAAPRPIRDTLFMATTAEEAGLLGAEHFATHPIVQRESIVAAINLDTVAIAPAGEPVAILNRDIPGLTALVEATATAMGRRMDTAHEADMMATRQDGWALARHGIPAFMVGGSFASMARLNAFLEGRYHGPDDEADGTIELGGAAEDANLMVALARRLADPAAWRRPLGSGE
jgi:Zn-dependent M28 family amino/carboxypeptidase